LPGKKPHYKEVFDTMLKGKDDELFDPVKYRKSMVILNAS